MKREKICRTDQQDEAENVPEEKKGGCGPALLAGFIFLAAAGCGAGFLYGKYLKPGNGDGR